MDYDAYNTLVKRLDKVCNSMIIVSVLMIVSLIITIIGYIEWGDNFSFNTRVSEAQHTASTVGGIILLIGGIITILLAITLISLLIYRKKLKKKTKIPLPHTTKIKVSTILSVVSLLLLAMFPYFVLMSNL